MKASTQQEGNISTVTTESLDSSEDSSEEYEDKRLIASGPGYRLYKFGPSSQKASELTE